MPRVVLTEQIAQFFDLALDAFVIAGADGYFRAVNRAFQNLTGYSEDELCSQPFYTFIHPEDRDNTVTVVRGLHKGDPDVRRMENRYIRKDGEVVWFEWRTIARGDLLYGAARDVTNDRAHQALVAHRATHDALTGLANRYQFDDRLQHALAYAERHGTPVHVVMMDLDNFKTVNDTLGHAGGDTALVEVARRLAAVVRPADTLARLGGDEFALLIESEPAEAVPFIATRLAEALAQPVEIGRRSFRIDISMGTGSYPAEGGNAATVLRKADAMMYRVKQQRRRHASATVKATD